MKNNLFSTRNIVLLIILLGLFFRLYKLEIFYPWGHDQDLFAWISKDILVDHHIRMIGQETSITGVFIGPLIYYLIAFSFALFNMNPLSASLVTTIISLFTIFSIFWVFNKFFGRNVGLIGSLIYAISAGTVFGDRWIVPTQPTPLWATWYLFILLSILEGNIQILIPLTILLGLIWHVHIAFIPLLSLLPVVFFLSKKKFKLKHKVTTILISLVIFLTLIAPFLIFEIRHGFQQTQSLTTATYQDRGDLTGLPRLIKVLDAGGRALLGVFVLSNIAIGINQLVTISISILLILGILILGFFKILRKDQVILFSIWYLIVFFGQFISKRIITEYYFSNILIVFILLISLFLNKIDNQIKRSIIPIFLAIYLLINFIWLINRPDDLGGYLYKRQVVEFIKLDAKKNNYPCLAINHIEGQRGGPTGYRYLFWYYGLNVITSGNDVPVYNIVNPWTISAAEITDKFGKIGVIVPAKKTVNPVICQETNRQLLPLWGFNN